jgi:hypothetical protein
MIDIDMNESKKHTSHHYYHFKPPAERAADEISHASERGERGALAVGDHRLYGHRDAAVDVYSRCKIGDGARVS